MHRTYALLPSFTLNRIDDKSRGVLIHINLRTAAMPPTAPKRPRGSRALVARNHWRRGFGAPDDDRDNWGHIAAARTQGRLSLRRSQPTLSATGPTGTRAPPGEAIELRFDVSQP